MAPTRQAPKSTWLNPLTVVGGSILLFFLCQFSATVLLQPVLKYIDSTNYQLAVYISFTTVVLFGWLQLVLKVSGYSWHQLGWRRPTLKALLRTFPILLLYMVVSYTATSLASRYISSFDAEQAQDIGFKSLQTTPELAAAFFGLVILTPIFEEVIFRGVLFKGLRSRLPFWVSAGLSSAVFALAHGQWNLALDTFALGMASAWLLERFGSLGPSILLHTLKNGLAFYLLFFYR